MIDPVNWMYADFPPVRWVWLWIPDAPEGQWWLSLLSSAGLCALFYFLFGIYLNAIGMELRTILVEAKRDGKKRRISEDYHPINTQVIGPINAGGNVNIEQAISNNPQLEKWEGKFSNGPIALIIIAVIGGVLTPVLAQLLGLAH